jgi:hypothetical protein
MPRSHEPNTDPTTDEALNGVLRELIAGAREALGENFVAAYLQGSFAVGDWDVDSDVDFLIATERDPSPAEEAALNAMHHRLYRLSPHWAQHLEGSYIPRDILRRVGPSRRSLLFLDNTSDRLERSKHDDTAIVRWVTRERGVTLAGPPPTALIAPVSADELRHEVRQTMREWARQIRAQRYSLANQWAQPFVVLSYCRMLQTLATGRVESKRAGAEWAQRTLDARWADLIRRAWEARPNPSLKVHTPADPADQQATLAFIQYALEQGGAQSAGG